MNNDSQQQGDGDGGPVRAGAGGGGGAPRVLRHGRQVAPRGREGLPRLARHARWVGTQVASSLDYRVTILDSYSLLTTRIRNVLSTCLGNR